MVFDHPWQLSLLTWYRSIEDCRKSMYIILCSNLARFCIFQTFWSLNEWMNVARPRGAFAPKNKSNSQKNQIFWLILNIWLIGMLFMHPTSKKVNVQPTKIAGSSSLCTHMLIILFPVWAGIKREIWSQKFWKIKTVWLFWIFDILYISSRPAK